MPLAPGEGGIKQVPNRITGLKYLVKDANDHTAIVNIISHNEIFNASDTDGNFKLHVHHLVKYKAIPFIGSKEDHRKPR